MVGMKSLFDLDKPHFAAWIGLYDIDTESSETPSWDIPNPLYYSALCGFRDLVQHLAIRHPRHVNAIGGSYGFPLVAALCRHHFRVAELLLKHGANVNVRDTRKQTALHRTVDRHDKVSIDAVNFLLERGVDVNARRDDLCTPLHLAVTVGELTVARVLLDRRADVNSRNDDGQTPLHLLSSQETSRDEGDGSELAKLLLERGANVNEKDKNNATPLHLASYYKRLEIVRVLLSNGANINVENNEGKIPLQIALSGRHNSEGEGVGVAQLFLEHGAKVIARDKYEISASDLACCFGGQNIGEVLGDATELQPDHHGDRNAFRLWIDGEFTLESIVLVSNVLIRDRRRRKCTRQIRDNPVTCLVIPWEVGDVTEAA